jgi:hypothetical protein
MTKKKDGSVEQGIQISFDEGRLRQMDQHLERLTAGIPGATITRAGWIKAIVCRELDAAKGVPAAQKGADDSDRGPIGQGRGD